MTITRTSRTSHLLSTGFGAAAAAVGLLVLSACGASTTTASPAASALPAPSAPVTVPVTVPPATVSLPPVTPPLATVPPASVSLPPVTVPPVSLPPVTLPPVTLPPVTLPPLPPPVATCGVVGDEPPFAAIVSEQFVDVVGDGSADDRVLSHTVGGWTLRATVGGVTSELTIDDVGPGAVRVLGVADVGELTAGNEILATTGAGASTTEVGIFGIDPSGCLFHFADQFGEDLVMPVGASIGFGDRFFCGTHLIGANSWSLYEDGTYDVAGAAYYESSPGTFTYLPASDDYSEGVPADELPSPLFDCFGLSL
ncbi:MAG: hypothetical protein ACE37B_17290 [Ilumatobacter sp.]|uniref:hypothetical protein n=1 Tax=Ilumatobacter sp. TaxID=1967498 RepID=UPI00391D27EE